MIVDALSVGIALILFALVAWMWSHANTLRDQLGIPEGKVIYTDAGTWFPNQEHLSAEDIQLTGKPDYLVEQADGMIIPVEVKSSAAPEEPWDSHLYQVAAYCFLVEASYGVRPDYGILQYRDRAFAIDYTEELEDELLDIVEEMRLAIRSNGANRDHHNKHLC
ncbi:MAG: Dna2/Cas4 domain-containing protein, partial [Chloroflexota bacterium]